MLSRVEVVLRGLAQDIGERPVGVPANETAVELLRTHAGELGYRTEELPFECLRWESGGSWLQYDGHRLPIIPSPFSERAEGRYPLREVATLSELLEADIGGCILLFRDELSALPYMPKDFPFYYPDEHKRIIDLLESRRPSAIVGLTGRHPSCGLDPFPLFEDGDFSIPSAYHAEGAIETGGSAEILIESTTHPSRSTQLIFANATGSESRIVVCAHMDTKYGTPGALDNAAGVAVMFGIMERLAGSDLPITVEFVPFNSEEYYGVHGELLYRGSRPAGPSAVRLAVNLDGLGHRDSQNAFSLYNLPDEPGKASAELIARRHRSILGGQWYEGDHTMFAQEGIRTVAVTSANAAETVLAVTHTDRDTIDQVDVALLEEAADIVTEMLLHFAARPPES